MARHDFDPATVTADEREAAKERLFDPSLPGAWRGHLAGELLGAANTILAYGNDTVGEGPRLHVHPYDEIFIIVEGHARFFVGSKVIDVEAGEVVLGPKGIPHRFENRGPGRLQTIDIHLSPRWLQTDL